MAGGPVDFREDWLRHPNSEGVGQEGRGRQRQARGDPCIVGGEPMRVTYLALRAGAYKTPRASRREAWPEKPSAASADALAPKPPVRIDRGVNVSLRL